MLRGGGGGKCHTPPPFSQRGNTTPLRWHQLQRRGNHLYLCVSGDPQMVPSVPCVTCLPSLKKQCSVLRAPFQPSQLIFKTLGFRDMVLAEACIGLLGEGPAVLGLRQA